MDPSFRSLHGKASHVCGAAETLLVSVKRKHGCNDEAGVFNVSSGKALCHVAIIGGYVLANVCNGFLCFVLGDEGRSGREAPALVCNPATGETGKLPGAPWLSNRGRTHLFALGFSPSTNEYKLFRLSADQHMEWVDVDVYTLGDSAGGWRCRPYSYNRSVGRPSGIWAPVSMDGKLYVATHPWNNGYREHEIADSILVIDVCTEKKCDIYGLPSYWTPVVPPVSAFELNGRLCFAAHTTGNYGHPEAIHFWVMPPDTSELLSWDKRYSFHMEGCYTPGSPWAVWLDESGMLCYMEGSTLHRYI